MEPIDRHHRHHRRTHQRLGGIKVSMSELNDLITRLCPDGVPYKKLGDLCKIETGRLNANKAVDNGAYPFFTTAEKTSRIDSYRWDTEALLIAGNANVGSVKHYTGKFEAYQRTYVLTNFNQDINVRFLFHFTRTFLKKYLSNKSNSAAMTYIVLSTLKNFEIPLPPLPIQEKIACILDSFTKLKSELEDNLESELADRKEQYEYYRDHLLNKSTLEKIDGTVIETKKLGEVCNYVKNKVDIADVLPENYTSVENLIKNCGGRMNAISIPKDGKCTDVMIGDILLGNIRPNLRKAWLATCAGGASNDVLVIRIKDGVNLNPRYLYQIIAGNDFSCYNIQHMKGAKMPRGDKSKILNYEFPVPSLATQERIVDILDRLNAFTTSLTDGIPAEIEMRRKQYEFYCSHLLDFPRLPEDAASDGE